jgi:hypothetical protein
MEMNVKQVTPMFKQSTKRRIKIMEVHHVFLSLIRVKIRGHLCTELYLPVGDMVRPRAYVVILQRKLQQNPSYLMYIDVSQ